MKKIIKIALIFLLCFITVLVISIKQSYPISISSNTAVFFQIPLYFWLVILISPFLLYIIAKSTQNRIILISCSMLYFFLFYSFSLYFISSPTISDVDVVILQEITVSITHISPREIVLESYLQFPVYFLFSKIFSSILGTAPIITNNLGFLVLITILPILLSLFYEHRKHFDALQKYFIIPSIYLILAYYFLNDQFVPQFMALIYLIITFGFHNIFIKTKNNIFLFFMIIFYILTIFSHGFIFIFFIIAVLFEKLWLVYVEPKEETKLITYDMLILLITIPMIYMTIYLNTLKAASITYGSQRIFDYIFGGVSLSEVGFQVQPFYNLIPPLMDQVFSNVSKIFVGGVFTILTISFLLSFFNQKKLFDLGIILASFSWFILGFFHLVLGERSLQVTPIALSGYFKHKYKLFSFLSKMIIVVILLFPFFAIGNTFLNDSLGGEKFIQDYEENIAGRFLDRHLITNTTVLCAQNPYPIGDPTQLEYKLKRYALKPTIDPNKELHLIDFIIISPKLNLKFTYLNVALPKITQECKLYCGRNIEIITP